VIFLREPVGALAKSFDTIGGNAPRLQADLESRPQSKGETIRIADLVQREGAYHGRHGECIDVLPPTRERSRPFEKSVKLQILKGAAG
jgi:hypothetical protein